MRGNCKWNRLTLSLQHRAGVFAEEQHERVLPVVRAALAELEARGLAGLADLPPERFVLNGMGDFIVGGPEGDNGLSGKKLAIDFYGPEIPIGGGAICGKDPHKVDVAGAFRARELAVRLLRHGGDGAPRLDAGRRRARLPRGGADRLAGAGASDSPVRASGGRLVFHRLHRLRPAPCGDQPPAMRTGRIFQREPRQSGSMRGTAAMSARV